MSTANPEPYSEAVRLAEIIADARELLGRLSKTGTRTSGGSDIGELEAALKMLADSAEIVAEQPRAAGGSGG